SLRYQSKSFPLSAMLKDNNVLMLDETFEELSEVSLFSATNAKKLIFDVLDKKEENYFSRPAEMTAFYRESIKKRRSNVSLAEAVVSIYKKPYDTRSEDEIAIIKARKSADYDKLDTLAIKFRGGPYNTLYIDLMKYPERVLDQSQLDNFKFTFAEPAKNDDRYLYVVNFEELDKNSPWYFGKLYVDAETLTLVKASFNLNLDNKKMASEMFVKKKPNGTKVRPVEVHYEINYRERDGKWSYGYGSATMELVVDWKRKLFNSRYTINSEMAVTDWKMIPEGEEYKNGRFIDDEVVMSDDISGFADSSFWGDNNIIEPDKSIQNAIDKIQQKMNFD
ncbi:MAG TPA: carboxypeptidase-like regulatory domain-containing protein, partial [Salinimicrobium sp.]|nr:carboxypeptidase-like regulatory domain-containing protein [Salinimicrobium sp.]